MLYPRSVNYINVYSLRKKETTAFCLQNSWKLTSSLLFIYEILFTFQEKKTQKKTIWRVKFFFKKRVLRIFMSKYFMSKNVFECNFSVWSAKYLQDRSIGILKNTYYLYFRNDRKSTKIELSRRFYFYLMKVVGLQTCYCSDFFEQINKNRGSFGIRRKQNPLLDTDNSHDKYLKFQFKIKHNIFLSIRR